MKKSIVLLMIIFLGFSLTIPVSASNDLAGKIFLQVEKSGEAWYVYPEDKHRYYLGRPIDAFNVMRDLGLGAKHEFIIKTNVFPKRLSGMIILDVELNGEAYYINPVDLRKYYLGRPSDAFAVMNRLGIGITNNDLFKIEIGNKKTGGKDKGENTVKNVLMDVPFTSQAPFAEWSDIRQEDGCEEASSLMAVYWARGLTFSKQKALEEIKKSSDYEEEKYGEYRDVSSFDTLNRIIKDYFKYDKAFIKSDVIKKDLIDELEKGNILIVPINGILLSNPHYTQPGPPRHMLVIKGYNNERDVFITNDPGTRYGEGYEYNTDIFYRAIRDYRTGFHKDILDVNKKIIVIVKDNG